jgi:hypothetical protein
MKHYGHNYCYSYCYFTNEDNDDDYDCDSEEREVEGVGRGRGRIRSRLLFVLLLLDGWMDIDNYRYQETTNSSTQLSSTKTKKEKYAVGWRYVACCHVHATSNNTRMK